MVATLQDGQLTWGGGRNAEGQRTYKLLQLVETDTPLDGPAIVMQTPGLPIIGSIYNYDNDIDVWAFCSPEIRISAHKHKDGDPVKLWKVENTFTTLPTTKCQDESIEDPLLEPQKISGSFVKYTKEVTQDKDGNYLKSSSHEMLRGPQVEFDFNRPTVQIGQNIASLGLNTFSSMVDKVNSVTQWGLPVRTIKLSNVSWERKVYGSCGYYYTRNFEFDIDFTTFDKTTIDEGEMVLDGDWSDADPPLWDTSLGAIASPSASNPTHFVKFIDNKGNPIRALLDGSGEPITAIGSPTDINIQYYQEANFFTLGIPTTL